MAMRILVILSVLFPFSAWNASWACVGKTIVVGAVQTPEGRAVAQVIAILINERTGTTVKITDFPDEDSLHQGLARGDADIAVEHIGPAMTRAGVPGAGTDSDASYQAVKEAYLERLNLVWLPRLGFGSPERPTGEAAPVARKDTLKQFPALPRLIAKTEGILTDDVVRSLAASGEPSKAARGFLRDRKLI